MRPRWGFYGALLLTITVSRAAIADEPIPPVPSAAAASPTVAPKAAPREEVATLEERMMTLPEMDAFFDTVKIGTAVRLTFINGADYAGNFEGKEDGKSVITCRRGLFARNNVPLSSVRQAYVLISSTDTLRIRRSDFRWSEK